MKYTIFGQTGMQVSKICLGCMTYGDSTRGGHSWTLTEQESRPLLRQAVEAGINFFDTANAYSNGSSEEILGRALKDFCRRDEVVIATKAFAPWRMTTNTLGLSRKALFHAVDDSLSRLGTDYIDLFQIHRWDDSTPIEVTLDALSDLVKSGKIRYIGASTMFSWQLMKSLHISEVRNFSHFVSMQNYYNLLYREEEREMIPLLEDQGIAMMPWSPLARGRLTRDWDEETARSQTDEFGKMLFEGTAEHDRKIVETVSQIASDRGIPRAQVAMAWMLSKPFVTTPIVGASKRHHIEDCVASLEVELTSDEISALEADYVPHDVQGMAPPMRIPAHVSLRD